MKKHNIVVVGGGYAGIHAIDGLRKELGSKVGDEVRIILLDKNPYHLKKVRMVRLGRPVSITVPFQEFGWQNVEVRQGELVAINPSTSVVWYTDSRNQPQELLYDRLVLALGSVAKTPPEGSEGIVLGSANDVERLRNELQSLDTRTEQSTTFAAQQKPSPHVIVVGGGLSGIEIAADMAVHLNGVRRMLGLPTIVPTVSIVHSGDRLLPEAPARVGHKLENKLSELGVRVMCNTIALKYEDGLLITDRLGTLPADLLVWALGTQPHPLVRTLGLPVHEDGRLLVDGLYRVQGHSNIYAIGDCARVVDAVTGKVDGMTCKEAMVQGKHLAKVVRNDVAGVPTEAHRGIAPTFCIGLGPQNGFIWTERWGIDFILTGKLGGKVREYTWNLASLAR